MSGGMGGGLIDHDNPLRKMRERTLDGVQRRVARWRREHFPGATAADLLGNLREEMQGLEAAEMDLRMSVECEGDERPYIESAREEVAGVIIAALSYLERIGGKSGEEVERKLDTIEDRKVLGIAPPGEDADPTEFVERTAQRSGGASC